MYSDPRRAETGLPIHPKIPGEQKPGYQYILPMAGPMRGITDPYECLVIGISLFLCMAGPDVGTICVYVITY